MRAYLRDLWSDESGITTVEYALVLALVTIASVSAWSALGSKVRSTLTQVSNGFATPLN